MIKSILRNSHFWLMPCALGFCFWMSYSDSDDITTTVWFLWVATIFAPIVMQIRGNSWPYYSEGESGENPVTHIYDLFRGKKLDEQSLITAWVVLGYFISATVALIVVNITG